MKKNSFCDNKRIKIPEKNLRIKLNNIQLSLKFVLNIKLEMIKEF